MKTIYSTIIEEQVASTAREGVEVFGKDSFKVIIIDTLRATALQVFTTSETLTRNDIALQLETPILPQHLRKEVHYRVVALMLPLLFTYMVDYLECDSFGDTYKFVFHMIDALDEVLEGVGV